MSEKHSYDNIKEKILIDSSRYFLEFNEETPDYNKICYDVKMLTEARFVILNLFNEDATRFTTVAISGVSNIIKKADILLGFKVLGFSWKKDTEKEKKIKDNVVTVFKSLCELTGKVLPKPIVLLIEKTFNVGNIVVVRIMKEDKMLGDFTLIMPVKNALKNSNLLEIYAHQFGLFLTKHRTEKELKRFFTVNLDLLLISDNDARFLKFNPAWTELFGYTEDEIKERNFFYFIHPEDIAPTKEAMSRLGKYEEVKGFINRYRCRDGLYRSLEWRAHSVGQLIYASARDITKFIEAEHSLRKSQQRYELISQNMGSIITMLDINMNFLYVSPSIEKFTFYTPEEYKLLKLSDIMTPDSYALVQTTLKHEMQLEAKGKADANRSFSLELQQYRKDGKVAWVEVIVTYMRNPDNSIYAFLTVGTEITTKKLSEQKLKQSEEKYRNLVDNSFDIIYTLAIDGTITFVSKAWERQLKHKTEDIIGNRVQNLVHPEELSVFESFTSQLIKTGERHEGVEFRIKDNSGMWQWFSASGIRMTDKNGVLIGFEGIARNITLLKRNKQADDIRLDMIDFAINHSLDDVLRKALDYVGGLINSPIAFYHFLEDDQKTLTLQQWSTATTEKFCTAESMGVHYNIDKAGVWVDCVKLRKPVIHNDYDALPHKKGMPKGHAEVIRELVVPVMRQDKIVAILGIGNKPSDYTQEDVDTVSYLADVTWEIVENKRAEALIQESEEKYRMLFENSPDPYLILEDYLIKDCNKPTEEIFRCHRSHIIGKHPYELSPKYQTDGGNSKRVSEVLIKKALKEGKARFEWKQMRFDKSEFWVEVSLQAMIMNKKKVLFALLRDISERKEMEISLHETNEYLENLFNYANAPIIVWNKKSEITRLNKAFETLSGYKSVDLIGKKLNKLFPENKKSESLYFIDKTLKGERWDTVEIEIQRKDNTIRTVLWNSANIYDNVKNNILATLAQGNDITERKLAEKTLRQSEEKYRLITENTSDVIWVLNLNQNRFTYISPSVFELRGLTADEALKEKLEDMIPDAFYEEVKNLIAFYLQKIYNREEIPQQIVYELQQFKKDKSLVWVEISIRYSFNRDNEVELIGVSRNIENRKKLQSELIEAKEHAESANKAKSEFLANMSHEIRTPLNGVIGFADLLQNSPLTPMQKQYVDNINTSAQSLLGVISDILDFSKIEAGKMELDLIETDIIELCEQTIDIVKYQASQKDIELLLNIPAHMPRIIVVDPVRFKQLLLNLLNNAIKFTPKGEVELKLEFTKIKGKRAQFNFSVRDTGIGIKENNRVKLFKAFSQADTSTTRQYGGTGLGLIISDYIAKKMGSAIEFDSEPNKGSTFRFCFESDYRYTKKNSQKNIKNIKRVLVIDDNQKNRMILEQMLNYWGIDFYGCEDGMSAFKMIKKSEPFDVIIVDYQMPFMNGLETIKMIRDKLPAQTGKKPVILLHSSVDDSKLHKQCKEMGVRFNIIKPVKSKELYNYLENIEIKAHIPKETKFTKDYDFNIEMYFKTGTPVILIAEDVKMNQELIKALTQKIIPDAIILEASNGNEVLNLIKKQQVDLVFMDIQMPELDGIETTKTIRNIEDKKISTIPVVALTAGATKEEKEKCEMAGMDGFLSKPIDKNLLIKVLKQYVIDRYPNRKRIKKNKVTHFNKDKFFDIIGHDNVLGMQMFNFAEKQISELMNLLGSAIDTGNQIEIKNTAHKLKGTSLNMCFDYLTQLAHQVEENYQEEHQVLEKLYKKIVKEWDLLIYFLIKI